jgi:hypothetical protein
VMNTRFIGIIIIVDNGQQFLEQYLLESKQWFDRKIYFQSISHAKSSFLSKHFRKETDSILISLS